MNKLYIINIYYKFTGYLLGTATTWDYVAIQKKRRDMENDGFIFNIQENNDIHLIYNAR